MNRLLIPLIAINVALLLGGCSTPAGLGVFQRGATLDDHLPAGLHAHPKMKNSRLLAESDGVRYFAAQAEGPNLTCLVKVPHDNSALFVVGCGNPVGTGQIVTVSGADGSAATLVTDGFDTKELEAKGWRKIQANVLVGRR